MSSSIPQVRTNYILSNLLLKKYENIYDLEIPKNENGLEEQTLEYAQNAIQAFKEEYEETLLNIVREIESEPFSEVIMGISPVILGDGITWGRIITIIAFVDVYIRYNHKYQDISNLYNLFYDSFDQYTSHWICDRGGWENLYKIYRENSVSASNSTNPGFLQTLLMKCLLTGGIVFSEIIQQNLVGLF